MLLRTTLLVATFFLAASVNAWGDEQTQPERLVNRFAAFCLQGRIGPEELTRRAEQQGAVLDHNLTGAGGRIKINIRQWHELSPLEPFQLSVSWIDDNASNLRVVGCQVLGPTMSAVAVVHAMSDRVGLGPPDGAGPPSILNESASWSVRIAGQLAWLSVTKDALGVPGMTLGVNIHQPLTPVTGGYSP